MNDNNYFVYILGNVSRKVLYKGFVKKYQVHDLLYFEHTMGVYGAIEREKELKSWRRQKKFALILDRNPQLKTIDI